MDLLSAASQQHCEWIFDRANEIGEEVWVRSLEGRVCAVRLEHAGLAVLRRPGLRHPLLCYHYNWRVVHSDHSVHLLHPLGAQRPSSERVGSPLHDGHCRCLNCLRSCERLSDQLVIFSGKEFGCVFCGY